MCRERWIGKVKDHSIPDLCYYTVKPRYATTVDCTETKAMKQNKKASPQARRDNGEALLVVIEHTQFIDIYDTAMILCNSLSVSSLTTEVLIM